MSSIIVILNLIAASASALASGIALFNPSTLSGSLQVEPGEVFYARMYAARSIPLGIVVGVLPFWAHGTAVVTLLCTAAFIQAVDVVLGIQKRDWGMVRGASVGTIIHVLCALGIREP
ncbi:hypothetical protein BP5796_09779 [Coleophoma crateriformis]|uniref:Uncharacterized protein n=1 Tax=Coleophoma crateriformis TaxID=565419 RepID=A0A3D8QZD0_9HELO|nr:hypothetical protein BP5796_09779 [Coleophoma crateriformis]